MGMNLLGPEHMAEPYLKYKRQNAPFPGVMCYRAELSNQAPRANVPS